MQKAVSRFRLQSSAFARKDETEKIEPKRMVFLSVEGDQTERTYFGYLEKMVVFDLSSRFKSKSTLFLLVVFCSITGILY